MYRAEPASNLAGDAEAVVPPARTLRLELAAVAALLALQLGVALVRINAPYTEPAAYGRSCINATIARNYVEHGFRFFYPQLDYGRPPGYAALEFPLVPYGVALIYQVVGIHDWVGRAVAAGFGLAATIVVYLIACELFPLAAARVWAVLLMVLSPMFAFFSRVFQSDSAMICFAVLTTLLLLRWRRSGRPSLFAWAVAACAVTMLLKPSSFVLLPAFVSLVAGTSARARARAAWLIAVPVVSVAAFYLHVHFLNAYPETMGLVVVARRATVQRVLQIGYDLQIARDVVQAVTPLGVIVLLVGTPLALLRRPTRFLSLWVGGVAALDLAFNEALSHHEYYQMLWVPASALLAGVVWSWIQTRNWSRTQLVLVGATVAVLLAASIGIDWRFLRTRLDSPTYAAARAEAARAISGVTPPNALIAAEEIDVLYYAHRRGWIYASESGAPVSVDDINSQIQRGAQFFASTTGTKNLSPSAVAYLSSMGPAIAADRGAMVWRLRPRG